MKGKLETAHLALKVAVDLFMAWHVAKILCPELTVYESVAIARMRKLFPAREDVDQRQADEFVAEVTQYVRGHE